MKATLVALAGDRKIYYIADAQQGEDDGAIVKADGGVIYGNFFNIITKTTNVKRLRKTPLQKFLWAPPTGEIRKIWFDTFIFKKVPLDKKFIDTSIIKTNLDEKSELSTKAHERIENAFKNGFEQYETKNKYKMN